jgi:hypothetical protein
MMRWNGFGRSLLFAACVAAGLPALWLVLGSALGTREVVALYWIGSASLYVAGIAPSWRRGLLVALPAAGIGLLAWLLSATPMAAAVSAAGVVAICRSGVLYRSRPARALAIEVGLGLGGLLLARLLAGPGPLATAAALWGYFLVQSLFFLIGGVRQRRTGPAQRDPFERARSRMLALLGEDGA